ncbi:methyltransferase [Streptomyces badius]
MNADHMIDTGHAQDQTRPSAPQRHARQDRAKAAGALDWAEWWAVAAEDPVLAAPTAARFEMYGEHADGDMPSAAWHVRALVENGFGEARAVWASPFGQSGLAVR